ncbi:hypothetical protein [Vibrio sp. SCSIO 43136]|nr:hypothetical protein [Vibrio sp. SCSIO 43136]USD67025.1 hypothetical protein J4N39_20525 [Vibrio sp. SCSIO 43136]
MTINKYYVFFPQEVGSQTELQTTQESQVPSDIEAQRQALVKQAQQQGEV